MSKYCPLLNTEEGVEDCMKEKCGWWRITHSPSIDDGECAILNIANGLIELKYKEE